MIDLHLHILPGVDDGPRNLGDAVAMLDWFASAGYSRLVATPHLMEPLNAVYADVVRSSFAQMEPLARDRGIRLDLGYEHMVASDLPSRLAEGERSTLAGSKAILIEFPFIGWDYRTDRTLFDIQQLGFRPILAHPERYEEALKRPELIEALAERGVVLQITLAAIAGTYGPGVRELARRLLVWSIDAGTPFILATDGHVLGRRLFDSIAGRTWIERNLEHGSGILEWAGDVVPAALLGDLPLPSWNEWLLAEGRSMSTGNSALRRIRALNPLAKSR